MNTLYPVIKFFASGFWFIWPLGLAADYFLSRGLPLRHERLRIVRWLPRVCHCLAIAGVITVMWVEHFWLDIVKVHYHGGRERYWVGLAFFVLCMLFAHGFDVRGVRESVKDKVAETLSIVGAVLLAFLMVFGALSDVLHLRRFDFEVVLFMFLFTLVTMRCLPRSGHCKICLTTYCIMLAVSVTGLMVCWIASGFKFLGQLAYKDDDLWYLVFASIMPFGLLSGAAWLERLRDRRKNEMYDVA